MHILVAGGSLALRFGHLYGPGSSYALTGRSLSSSSPARSRSSAAAARLSFIHADDAATAIVAALHKRSGETLNIVDDDPTLLRPWLPVVARLAGAPLPKRLPRALARLADGGLGVVSMIVLAGADDRRARHKLDWRPTTQRGGTGSQGRGACDTPQSYGSCSSIC